jgi:hypothetical protein
VNCDCELCEPFTVVRRDESTPFFFSLHSNSNSNLFSSHSQILKFPKQIETSQNNDNACLSISPKNKLPPKKSNGFSVIQMDDAQVPYFFPQAWQSRSGDSLCCHQGSTISNDR